MAAGVASRVWVRLTPGFATLYVQQDLVIIFRWGGKLQKAIALLKILPRELPSAFEDDLRGWNRFDLSRRKYCSPSLPTVLSGSDFIDL
jgi:hypothetical protein